MEMESNSRSDGSFDRYGHPIFAPIRNSLVSSDETVIRHHRPSHSFDLLERLWPSIPSPNGRFRVENLLKIAIGWVVCPLWLPQIFLYGSHNIRPWKKSGIGQKFHLVRLTIQKGFKLLFSVRMVGFLWKMPLDSQLDKLFRCESYIFMVKYITFWYSRRSRYLRHFYVFELLTFVTLA